MGTGGYFSGSKVAKREDNPVSYNAVFKNK
jgi:hypothetical protein